MAEQGFETELTLVQLRNLKNKNQQQLAKELNLSPAGFRKKENGENPISFIEAEKLAEIYELSLDEIGKIIHNTIDEKTKKS